MPSLYEFRWTKNGTAYNLYNNSLVLMFNFDNVSSLGEQTAGADNKTADVSNLQRNNGTLLGDAGPNWTANGRYGGAFDFDGVDDHIKAGTYGISSSSGTLETWFKPSVAVSNHTIISIPQEGSLDDTGLVLYMRFNNDSSVGESYAAADSTVHDYSPAGNDGTSRGGIGSNYNMSGGKFSGAFEFDGTDDSVNITDSDDFNFGASSFSIEFWYMSKAIPDRHRILDHFEGATAGWIMQFHQTEGKPDRLYSNFRNTDASELTLDANGLNLSNNIWYHVALVRTTSIMSLYLNGKLIGSTTTNVEKTLGDPNEFLLVGKAYDQSTEYLNGFIDELRIYKNRALSEEEVKAHYLGTSLFKHNHSLVFHSGNATLLYDVSSWNDNEWHHIAGSYHNSSKTAELYVNGTLVNSTAFRQGGNSSSYLYIGSDWRNHSSYTANGTIDEVRVWNISLSAGQILQNYNSNLKKYDTDRWNFNTSQEGLINYTAGFKGDGERSFEKYNSTQWYFYSNQTNLAEGTNYYRAFASDTAGNINSTEIREITVDYTAPDITLRYPNNNILLAVSDINFNWTVTDTVDKSLICNLTIDGKVNVSGIASLNGTHTNQTVYNFSQGTHSWNITCWDDTGNVNYSLTISFTVDVTYPGINFTYPTPVNGSSQQQTQAEINVSITESSLEEVKFSWNSTNYTIYNDSLVLMFNFDNVSSLGEQTAGAGNKTVDASRLQRNNGTLLGGAGPNWTFSGRYTGAFVFDGIDDHIKAGTTGVSSSEGTLETWVKLSTVDDNHTFISIPQEGAEKDSGLVLYFRFNNDSNVGEFYNNTCTNCSPNNWSYDYSGKGNIGKLRGNITYNKSGRFGGAFEFDGVDDFVTAGDPADGSLDLGTNDFSVSTWIKTSQSGNQVNVRKRAAGVGFITRTNTALEIYIEDTDSNSGTLTGTRSVIDGKWHHIVFVFDRDSNCIGYIDGIPEVLGDISGEATSISNSDPLDIGYYSDGPSQPFKGTIDEIRIYNRSLSAEEVRAHYLGTSLFKHDSNMVFHSGNATLGYDISSWNADEWHHIAGSYDNSSKTAKLYINGTEVNSTAFRQGGNNSPYLYIGSDWRGSRNHTTNGTIDEVRLWNISLSASHIKQHYFSNLNKYSADGWFFYSNQSNLSERTYNYQAFASDTAGNMNSTEIRELTIDMTSPNVSLNYPSAGATIKTSDVNFNWTVTDNYDSNLTCNLTINGTVNVSDIASLNGTPANQTVYNINDGFYLWNVTCWDGAGNINTSPTRNFSIDTTPPSVSLDSPLNGTWHTRLVTFTYTATDATLLDTCVLYGNFDGTWRANLTNTTAVSGIAHSFNLNLSDGIHLWNVLCNDTSGNNAFNATNHTIYVDATNASITLNLPHENYTTSGRNITFNWTATDNLDTNLTCNLTINGKVNVSDIASLNGTHTNQTVYNFSEGTYHWNVTCWDELYNINTSKTRMFMIDLTEPGITLNYPDNDAKLASQAINFNWTAIDNFDANMTCNLTINGTVNASNIHSLNGTAVNHTVEGIHDGIYDWNITCWDNANNTNTSLTRNLTIDTSPPSVSLDAPVNNTWYNSKKVRFNYTVSEAFEIHTCILYGNFNTTAWKANLTNSTVESGIKSTFEVNLSHGTYIWNIWCNDSSGNSAFNSTNYTINVDYTEPSVQLNEPSDNQMIPDNEISFNWTAADNMDNNLTCNLTINGTVNVSDINSPNGTYKNQTVTGIHDGVYDWNVTCWDNASNVNTSLTRNFTIDTILPKVSLDAPANNTWQKSKQVFFNYTATDLHLDTCIIYGNLNTTAWKANETNSSIVSGIMDSSELSLNNGSYFWNVWCNDSAGNSAFNSSNYTLYIDSMQPSVELSSPVNNYATGNTFVDFSWIAVDNTAFNMTCNLTINGTVNGSNIDSPNSTATSQLITAFKNGTYYWNVTCWDYLNNTNKSLTRQFTIDTTYPVVTLNRPLNSSWNKNPVTINYTVIGSNLHTCILYGTFSGSWQKNETNTTLNSGIPVIVSLDLSEGNYSWNVVCNNTAGISSWADNNLTFNVDLTQPSAELLYPSEGLITSGRSINFNWTVTDNYAANMACNLTINGTVNVSSISAANGTHTNQTVYNFSDGTYYWNITCWDNASNVNTSLTRNFTIDTILPEVSLDAPANNTWQRSKAVFFNYTAMDLHLDTCIIYGNLNTTAWKANLTNSTVESGIMDSSELSLNNGSYIWNVWCNDSAGNSAFNSTNYTLYIDSAGPSIELDYPQNNKMMILNYTSFNWTAVDKTDTNITCNLTIDGSVNASDIASLNGTQANYTVRGFSDGTHLWNITCWDDMNNTNTSLTRNFTVDTSPPSISLDSPSNNTWQLSKSITLSYTATDLYGLDTCILYTDFNGTWEANYTNTTASSGIQDSIQFNLTNRTYTWNVWCNDTIGNYAFNATNFTFGIDSVIPKISLNFPAENYSTSNIYINFNWTVTDLYPNMICNLTIDGKVNVSDIASLNGTPENQTVSGFTERFDYYWNVTCWDYLNNTNTSETRRFSVDLTPPWNITLADPTPVNNSNGDDNFIMNWTVLDNFDKKPLCYFVLDNQLNSSINATNGTYTNMSVYAAGGTHNISITCFDDANNSNSSETRIYIVSMINISAPAHYAVVRKNSQLRINVTEQSGEIFMDNVTGNIYNSSIQFINTSDSEWYADITVPGIDPSYTDIDAYGFSNSIGGSSNVSDTITIRVIRELGQTQSPSISYLCPNETYILNSSTARIDAIADLDTLVKAAVTKANASEPSLLASYENTSDYINILNYTYSNATPGLYTILFNITDLENNSAYRNADLYIDSVSRNISIFGLGITSLAVKDICSGITLKDGSSINYSVPELFTYDLDARFTAQARIFLRRANSSGNISFIDAANQTAAPSGQKRMALFDIISDINFTNYTLTYNYSNIQYIISDEADLKLWKCDNISSCVLTEVDVNINQSKNIITYEGSSLSRFMLTEPLETTTITTTTSGGGGGGGGGGASTTTVVETTRLASLNLMNPGPLSVLTGEEAITPVYLRNEGELALKGITNSVASNASNVTLRLTKSYIENLPVGGEEATLLSIKSMSLEAFGEYPITIKANVQNPDLETETKTYLNVIDKYAKNRTQVIKELRFVKDLFQENPECLELSEFLDQAEDSLKDYDFMTSLEIISSTIQACRDTVSPKISEELAPAAGEKARNLWIFIIEMILIIFIAMLMFVYRRRKARMLRMRKRHQMR